MSKRVKFMLRVICKRSFTLIELLVAIGVIAIFTGIALASYNQFTEQKKLDQVSKQFVNVLELAKTKTSAGDNSLCTGVSDPQVSKFSVNINGQTSYQLLPTCQRGTSEAVNYQTEANVVFLNVPPSVNIDFQPVVGGITEEKCLVIKNTNTNKCACVKINTSGVIEDNTCSDCSTCP